ncbi:NAD(P)-dependent oxidoreductase [Thalictrum thalictroides]|uniref:NAD(P)-dependent oxidoreductase n=1 Tax=Thalictrum thalictroides TaxID=46969 RepID=A0A7J6VFI2_THATH|nr:NAD(P)-dependent oxidoreductase [Thalictrum thalictroides]
MANCYISGSYIASLHPFVPRKPSPSSSRFPNLITCSSSSSISQFNKEKEKSRNTNRMFMLGFGYVAQFFAKELKKDNNWEIIGTCTSTMKKKKLEDMGFDVQLFDAHDKELRSLTSLVDATHLLVSIPPVVGLGDPVLYQHRDLLQSQLCNGTLQWLCYLSSTSVYGECGGAWVDEDYPVIPTSSSAKSRLVAEKGWLGLCHDLGLSLQVFRLGGIYGPGRSALDTIMKHGSLTESQRMRAIKQYTSRVHVADICQALKASIGTSLPGRIYNIVDDDPASRAEVFAFAQTLIEKKWPGKMKHSTFMSGSVGPQKILQGEKRVSNARLKDELGVKLIHPTYRSGLGSIIESIDRTGPGPGPRHEISRISESPSARAFLICEVGLRNSLREERQYVATHINGSETGLATDGSISMMNK